MIYLRPIRPDKIYAFSKKAFFRSFANKVFSYQVLDTQLGPMLCVWESDTLLGVFFSIFDQELLEKEFGKREYKNSSSDQNPLYQKLINQKKLSISVYGPSFFLKTWQLLSTYNTQTTYKELSERLIASKAHRAVANAMATNRLAFVLPCHLVLTVSNGLGGFRWGLKLKKSLIELEGIHNQLTTKKIRKTLFEQILDI